MFWDLFRGYVNARAPRAGLAVGGGSGGLVQFVTSPAFKKNKKEISQGTPLPFSTITVGEETAEGGVGLKSGKNSQSSPATNGNQP